MTRAIAVLLLFSTLAACEPGRSINPLARGSEYQAHCRRALDTLVAGDAEKERISIEDIGERERTESRRPTQAVTIVYRQGDSRRLMTCFYDPGNPREAFAISYRGEPLAAGRLAQVNAGPARR
jgi:hypothetical protein